MRKTNVLFPVIAFLVILAGIGSGGDLLAAGNLTVTAVNPLSFERPNQTIELSAKDLEPLGEKNLSKIHVKDSTGKDLLCQAVDTDGDWRADLVIFQSSFASKETKTFTAYVGEKWIYTRDQFKAYGRFVRERFDDFAWENDRIAHRMYGKALETWQQEPLTSSTVDMWAKRVTRLVINDWYMSDNYHTDTGEGADFYSAGPSRGNGGNGLWAADKLWVSKNFVQSRVLACGPIRILFELTYEPFDVNGTSVSEVKRISLDAGHNLNHYQSSYRAPSGVALTTGAGIKKADVLAKDVNTERGTLTTWQPINAQRSELGHYACAVLIPPQQMDRSVEDKLNILMLAKVPSDNTASYWAGFCWDKSGQFTDYAAWKTYIDQTAQGLTSPIAVTIR